MKNEEISRLDREKLLYEENVMKRFLEQFPANTHTTIASLAGMDIISCGTELSEKDIIPLRNGFHRLTQMVGQKAEILFNGLSIYIAPNFTGGGQSLPRINAILLDSKKMNFTVGKMEGLLSPTCKYRTGDQSRLVGNRASAAELGFVHELGHILEYRAYGDMDRGFADLDQDESSTQYGQRSPREDYAESWMYFIYGGTIDEQRLRILRNDIDTVYEKQTG